MSVKDLGRNTIKLGIIAFVYVTILTWICDVLGKVFAPVKDYLAGLFPETEATMEKKQKLAEDYFKLMGMQCLSCGMYVPRTYVLTVGSISQVRKETECQCCGTPFLENYPEDQIAMFDENQKKELEIIKRKRGII